MRRKIQFPKHGKLTRKVNAMMTRTAAAALALTSIFCVMSASADNYAYASDQPGDFGTMDLNTGVFTDIGNMGENLTGMADVGGTLYGGLYHGGSLYTVNPANGNLTVVGTSAESYELFGSVGAGLYALGTDNNLYSINGTTGAATLVGPTGTTLLGGYYGFSTGSSTLYYSDGPNLYTLNTTTGAATLVANMGGPNLGAMLLEGGVLYGGEDSPNVQVVTLDGGTGAVTSGPDVTGADFGNFWALAPDPLTTTAGVPDESSTISLLALGGLATVLLRRRSLA
jgi:hypothetical protein